MFDGMNGIESVVVHWLCASMTSGVSLEQNGEGKRIKRHG